MADTTYHRSKDLLEAEVGDELVALDADAGQCFGFNEVATSVWKSLERPKSFSELRDELLAEYEIDDEQCSQELAELLQALFDKGLIKSEKSVEQP